MYHQAARSLDLVPVLVTAFPSGGSSVASSERLQVSGMDVAAVLSAIDRIGRGRIAGVFASASARAELAARVASALDRPHGDPDAISLCNDKHCLRAFLERKGLNTVEYRHVTTVSDARQAASQLGGVVVVKPLSSSGSDGVRICQTSEEVASHAKRLLKRQLDGMLIEKYIDAPQYSVEVFDGKPLGVKKSYFAGGPFPYLTGSDLPAPLESQCLTELEGYACSVVKEVGLLSGPAFVELRYSGAEKFVIELNPRLSLYSPINIYVATDINVADICIKFSCGIHYDMDSLFKGRKNRACAGRFVARDGSSVRAIKGGDEARKVAGVKSVEIDDSQFYRRGPGTSALDRIVAIHSEADTIEEAAACAELALKKLTIIYDRFPMNFLKYYYRKMSRLLKKLSLHKRAQ